MNQSENDTHMNGYSLKGVNIDENAPLSCINTPLSPMGAMNEKKPTPETDALLESLDEDFDVELASMTAHACRMERERDEARKWCNIHWEGVRSTGKHCADAMNELQKTTEERDEARKLAEDMWMFDPQQRKLPWK